MAPASAVEDHFEVTAERPIAEIPWRNYLSFGALSRDGKSVLIVANGRVSMRPLESLEETEILPAGSLPALFGAWAGWSADEKWIYFPQQGDRPGAADLWRLERTTHKKEKIIKDAGGVSTARPSPSPDGKSIAFYRGKTLMLAKADGGNERVLCDHCDSNRGDLAWSPDSSRIVFPSGNSGCSFTLFSVPDKQLTPLPKGTGSCRSILWPAWSSGPFAIMTTARRDWQGTLPDGQIWHLNVLDKDQSAADRQWTQVTRGAKSIYLNLLGAGPDGYSLVVQTFPPPPDAWDRFRSSDVGMRVLGMFGAEKRAAASGPVPHTFMLTLKK
jgi:hypothetical protein